MKKLNKVSLLSMCHFWLTYFTLTSRDRCIPRVIPIGRPSAHSTAFPNKSESSITGPADHTI